MSLTLVGNTDAVRFRGLPTMTAGGVSKATLSFIINASAQTYTQAGMIMQHWSLSSRSGWAVLLDPGASDALRLIGYDATALRVDINTGVAGDDGLDHSVVILIDVASGQPNKIYVDGVQKVSGNSSANWITSVSNSFSIGDATQVFWTETCKSKISEVAYWVDVHLDAGQIDALNDRFSPLRIQPDKLDFYAPMTRNFSDRMTRDTITTPGSPVVGVHPRVLGGMGQ
jgi:hypothetical protein